ncbi:MAG: FecR domain-containing protein [Gallionella sp.]|nr:FecR domain-containing protein [Gallionella sp.]
MKQITRRLGQLVCFMWLCFGMATGAFAAANDIGVVMNVEGELTAKGGDGALRKLGVWGKVLAGDTLFTGKDSFARVKFSDGGQISLKPASQFKIEGFHYDEQDPKKDAAGFNLLKGGLRAISGAIGKRGDPDSYSVKTRTATVGIRGTKYGMLFCQGDCADQPPPADGSPLSDGTHLDVTEGSIIVRNPAGNQLLNAGQFGYVGSISTPPVMVPPERAIKVDIPAKIFVDRVRGQGPAERKLDAKVDPKAVKPGEAKSGEAKPGEGKAGEAKPGEGTPGSTESGGGGAGGGEPGGNVCPL